MGPVLSKRPRVVFLSNGGILGDVALRTILESGQVEVVGVVRSRRVMVRVAGFLRGAIAYFARCGVIYTVYIWTITTFAEFLGLFTKTGSITQRAKRQGIPILHTEDINTSRGRDFIENCRADLLISAHFDQKLDPPLCYHPERAAVNIHPSLLPQERGLEPVLHTMCAERSDFGVTVHRMAPDLDAGSVITSQKYSPRETDSVLAVTHDLLKTGAGLLIDSIQRAVRPGDGAEQQSSGNYNSWPTNSRIRELYRVHKQLVSTRDLSLFWMKT